MNGQGVRPREHLVALAIIFAAVIFAYTSPISTNKVYYSQDTSDINYVMLRSHVEDLEEHGFTAWCPHLGTGFYRAADPTFALYSPRLVLYLLNDTYNAQVATIIVYALLAGAAAYILGLSLVRSWACAVFLGLAWPLAGVMISRISNIPYFTSAAWYPLILAAFLAVRNLKLRIPLTAICVSMVAVEGDLVGTGVSLAVLGFLALASPADSRKKDLAALAASTVLVMGITAVIWMPALAVLPESRRGAGLPLEEALTFSLHPLRLVNLFAPRFFGQMYEKSIWMPEISNSLHGQGLWFQTVYLGMLTPLLLLAALLKKHYQRKTALSLTACAALLCLPAMGSFSPLVPAVMELAPFLKVFRFPAKLFTWSAMLVLAATAMGLRESPSILAEVHSRRRSALMASLIYGGAAVILMVWAVSAADVVKEQSMNPETSAVRILQDLVRIAIFTLVVPLIILFPASLQSFRGRPLILVAAGVAALDLLTACPVFSLNPRYDFFQPSKTAQILKQQGPGRVYIDDDTYPHWRAGPRFSLKYNWGVLDGISYTSGAYATVPKMIHELDDPTTVKNNPGRVFRLLSMKYVITTVKPRRQWIKRLRLAEYLKPAFLIETPNLAVYETSSESPRLFISRRYDFVPTRKKALEEALNTHARKYVTHLARESALKHGREVRPAPDPPVNLPLHGSAAEDAEIVSIREPDGDTLIIETELEKPGLLVIRDYSTRGWEALADGEEAVIYHADGINRAVFLDAGKHVVSFRFRPASLVTGAWISVVAVALTLTACLVFIGQAIRRKPRSRKMSTSA